MDPLLSVVIPTYQRNDLLAECLTRLAPGAQTLSPDQYEVVVTDDGKETTARAMIAERFPWARWVEGPHRGAATNRNSGVRHALAPWIVFTDDDCLPEPGWLEAYHKAIRDDVSVYEGKTICREKIRPLLEETPVNLLGGCLWSCNFMIAREAFDRLGGFDETFPYSFFEDVDFRERVRAAGLTFPFLEDAVVAHPPRPRNFGVAAGKRYESIVQCWYKAGHREPVRRELLSYILKSRVKGILDNLRLPDVWIQARSTMGEYNYVAKHISDWEQKYRERYQESAGAYPAFRLY